jgi:hypothetical protein
MSDSNERVRIRNEAIDEARQNDEMEIATARKLRNFQRATAVFGILLGATVASVAPFRKGHALHDRWESTGQYFVMLAMGLLPAFMLAAGLTFGLWRYLRSIRESHRKYAPPLSKHRKGSRGST